MPIPTPTMTEQPIFPSLTPAQIDATRTSAWLSTFEEITPKTSIVDLDFVGEKNAFLEWLDADSIFIPLDSQAQPGPSHVPRVEEVESDNDDDSDTSSDSEAPVYHLPKLNEAIRQAIKDRNGSVFPKLNWSAPKDAAFILPQTSHGPLHCTSPADLYLLLKSSDFVSHGLDPVRAYASGESIPEESSEPQRQSLAVELVLKEYVDVSPSREMRCFVRNNVLIGISQRDTNFYDHLQSEETRATICDTIRSLWEDEIRDQHPVMGVDYTFDVYLNPKLDDAMIIDINPYRLSTDSLLFSYPELHSIFTEAQAPVSESTGQNRPRLPILKVIDSAAHPEASRAAPAYGGNMMPLEMIEMSQGRSMDEFRDAWQDAVARGMTE